MSSPDPHTPRISPSFSIEGPLFNQSALCEPILRALPEWFGIESAVVWYLHEINTLPTFLARQAGEVLGFLSLKQHYPPSAEIIVMGVLPGAHRRGIGQALLQQAQAWLVAQGVSYLQVKTLAPSHPDPGYARTRAFYLAQGFVPLEEFTELWDKSNPCLLLVKKL